MVDSLLELLPLRLELIIDWFKDILVGLMYQGKYRLMLILLFLQDTKVEIFYDLNLLLYLY
jgi:hypothetical protein